MTRPKERVFKPFADSCPFRNDNKCNPACAFFNGYKDDGRCRLLGISRDSAQTGYFYEREARPYGNYY